MTEVATSAPDQRLKNRKVVEAAIDIVRKAAALETADDADAVLLSLRVLSEDTNPGLVCCLSEFLFGLYWQKHPTIDILRLDSFKAHLAWRRSLKGQEQLDAAIGEMIMATIATVIDLGALKAHSEAASEDKAG